MKWVRLVNTRRDNEVIRQSLAQQLRYGHLQKELEAAGHNPPFFSSNGGPFSLKLSPTPLPIFPKACPNLMTLPCWRCGIGVMFSHRGRRELCG